MSEISQTTSNAVTVGDLIEYLNTLPTDTIVRTLVEVNHRHNYFSYAPVIKYSENNFSAISLHRNFIDFGDY